MKSVNLVQNTVRTWPHTHARIREGMLIQWREIKRCVRRANDELLYFSSRIVATTTQMALS